MKSGRGSPIRGRGKQKPCGQPANAGGAGGSALLERARAHFDAGELVEAGALSRKVLEVTPEQPGALLLLAVVAYREGQGATALELAERVIALTPDVAEAHVCRGDALSILQRYAEAAESYAEASRLIPENADAFVSRGNALYALGRHEAALESFEKAIQLNSGYAEAHNNRGSALHAMERYGAALASFERAVELKPDFVQARRNRGVAVQNLAQQQAAQRPPEKTEASGRDLVFYCVPTDEVWNPETARTKGIGGSEEAVIWLSKMLAERGWRVTVYANCGAEAEYDGVAWKPYGMWNHRDRQDVTVIWRYPQLMTFEFNSGKVILDLHDAFPEGEFTPERLKRIDRIFVKSKFHRSLYPHIADEKFVIAPNGIDAKTFAEGGERDPMLLLNTSSSDRSLEAFLDCFAEIRKQVPGARAQWAYGWGVFDTNLELQAERTEWRTRMQGRLKELGVEDLGRVSHGAVAALYRRANIFAYPSEYAEIDCISLSKAMAAGAIPITTDFAAMGEKAGHGGVFLRSEKTKDNWIGPKQFHWEITEPEQKAEFVREAVRLLKNPPTEAERQTMREWARGAFDWNAVADAWHKVLVEPPAGMVEALLQRGRGDHVAGRLDEAEKSYREVLKVSPENAVALHLLGLIALQAGQAAMALELLDRAIAANPEDAEAYFNRGNALYAAGRYGDAAKSYGEAIGLNPENAEAYSNRGAALLALEEYEGARESCEQAIRLQPDYVDAYSNRGNALYALGRYEAALESFDRVIQLRPEDANAHNNRGNALQAMKLYVTALESYDRAIELNPMNAEARNNRGSALHALVQFEAALESFDKAIELRPDYADARANRENTREGLEQYVYFRPEYESENEREVFAAVKVVIKRLMRIEDLVQLKAELIALPREIRSHPVISNLRNLRFVKTGSSGRDLVFYCSPPNETWNPEMARTKGVGGSEEAVIWLSRLLHGRGWNVTVYANCGLEERDYEGVLWKPYWMWNSRDKQDVTVIWRYPRILEGAVNSDVVIADLHDVVHEREFTAERLKWIDKIFVKSRFHRWLYPRIPDEKFAIIPNGIDARLFEGEVRRDPMLLINTSSADRSMEAFLDCFAEIRKEVPDAKAQWAYGWGVWDFNFSGHAGRMEWKAKIQRRMQELGVEDLGRLSHDEVAELYRRASVFAYPSEMAEIDCISLSKAMAAGAIPVTTDFAALGEKAGHGGVFIHSTKTKETWIGPGQFHYEIRDPEQKAEFVREVVKLLRNPPAEKERESMRDWARTTFDWNVVADRWDEILRALLRVQAEQRKGNA